MIELAKANKKLWQEITPDTGDIRHCFNCGTCISVCPAAEGNPPLLIRRLVRMILLGLEEELLDDETAWACVSCNQCMDACPQGVKPFEVGLAIRRWQCRQDVTYIPPSLPELFETGHTQPVHKVGVVRKSVGLEEKPPSVVNDKESMERFQRMLKETEITKSAPYMFGE